MKVRLYYGVKAVKKKLRERGYHLLDLSNSARITRPLPIFVAAGKEYLAYWYITELASFEIPPLLEDLNLEGVTIFQTLPLRGNEHIPQGLGELGASSFIITHDRENQGVFVKIEVIGKKVHSSWHCYNKIRKGDIGNKIKYEHWGSDGAVFSDTKINAIRAAEKPT